MKNRTVNRLFGLGVGFAVVVYVAWIAFVVWAIFSIVTWLTSK